MFASLCLCVVLSSYADSASIDQSQSGNLNVQVDLKDLHIIALLKGGKEEYVDYDYAYDYNEMTIKPQNGTTPKPLNATISANSTGSMNFSTTVPAIAEGSTESTPSILNTTNAELEAATTPVTTAQDARNVTDSPTQTSMVSTTERSPNATVNGNGCKKGFSLNQKGDCELKLQNVGTNALLKLVKLSQQLKLRRERRTTTARRV